MDTIIEKKYLNGETALKPIQRPFLAFANAQLVPCVLRQERDGFVLAFDTTDLEAFDTVLNMDVADRYRALANVADLFVLQKEYTFSLAPANLLININLIPKVMERDIASNWSFIDAYKALIGTTILPAFSYEDFIQRGRDLCGKKPILEKIRGLNTVEDIKDALLDEYAQVTEKQQKDYVLLKKAKEVRNRILIPIFAALTVITFAGAGWFLFYQMPYDNAVIQAYASYEAGDYLAASEALAPVSVDRMTPDVKLMLARAIVRTEALSSDEREQILSELTAKSREEVLNYWICLGRGEYAQAVDYARRLLDNDLLLRSLEAYKTSLERNSDMDAADKAAILNSVKSEIDKLKTGQSSDNNILRLPQNKPDESENGNEDTASPDNDNPDATDSQTTE